MDGPFSSSTWWMVKRIFTSGENWPSPDFKRQLPSVPYFFIYFTFFKHLSDGQIILFNSDWNYFMFFQFFFMGWKTDFTVLGFFFTVFSTSEENDEEMVFFTVFFTENTQFQLSLNKVPFSTCKKFPHEIIFPCLKCFLFVIHLHLSWTLASPRKLGQQRSTWGANGSLRKNISRLGKMISFWKHFYRWEK